MVNINLNYAYLKKTDRFINIYGVCMTSRALFFGRFQPVHKGHVKVAEDILKIHDEIIFAVGMSTESHTPRNPFTAGERVEMIRLAMRDAGIPLDRVITVTIPTLEISIASVYYVVMMSPSFNEVYMGNIPIASMFRQAGYKVRIPTPYHREKYNGTVIRTLMYNRDPEWRELVEPSVARYLDEIKAEERIKRILDKTETHIFIEETD